MSDHITTYTGVHFYPTEPEAEGIRIEDVAHSLSLICRGNGHVKSFFSVGQHCLNCAREAAARGYSRRVVLACLLHDASEAYMSDVPRPFKKYLKQYQEFEDRLLEMIYEKYLGSPLTEEEEALVRGIDDDMLYFDLTELLGESVEGERPLLKTQISFQVKPFEEVEREYLEMYRQWRLD